MVRWILLTVLLAYFVNESYQLHQPNCGTNSLINKRIVGGRDATQHEFPWQVALRWRVGKNKNEHVCGGSLITERYVLTAAHCFELGNDISYYDVTLGDHSSVTSKGREQVRNIQRIIIHPEFNVFSYDQDIALIELDKNATLNAYVNTICLPKFIDFEIPGKVCTITGWGASDVDQSTASSMLRKVNVPLISHSTCNHQRSYAGKITGNMFCAGYPNGSADACAGDSGGPLQCFSPVTKQWVLNGITSWGEGCGTKHKYGVYVVVRHSLTWVNNQITIKKPTPRIPPVPIIPNQTKFPPQTTVKFLTPPIPTLHKQTKPTDKFPKQPSQPIPDLTTAQPQTNATPSVSQSTGKASKKIKKFYQWFLKQWKKIQQKFKNIKMERFQPIIPTKLQEFNQEFLKHWQNVQKMFNQNNTEKRSAPMVPPEFPQVD